MEGLEKRKAVLEFERGGVKSGQPRMVKEHIDSVRRLPMEHKGSLVVVVAFLPEAEERLAIAEWAAGCIAERQEREHIDLMVER